MVDHIGMPYVMSNTSAISMTTQTNNYGRPGYTTEGTKYMLAKHINDSLGKHPWSITSPTSVNLHRF